VIVSMQEADDAARLNHDRWDIGVIGNTVDDRGTAATDFVNKCCDQVSVIRYNPDEFVVECDDKDVNYETFREDLEWSGKKILIEASTLGFSEVLVSCERVSKAGGVVDIVYVEPFLYKLSGRTPLLHRRDFELSDEVPGYRGIPGHTLLLEQSARISCVFFLGYEERRLDRALEDFNFLRPDGCAVVFGVPAFQPGWEMDAFANNVRVMRERDLRGGVYFCGAESPSSAIETLTRIKQGLTKGERMIVAPIGTKPCGIGAALFSIQNPDVGILYDHPSRSSQRSEKVGNWHLYSIDFQ
jgi:hypothetical protein